MAAAIEPIEMRTTAANDWTWTLVGLVISVLTVYELVTSSSADWQTVGGIRGEWLYLLVENVVGVTGIRILVGGMALVLGFNALAAAWRLRDDGFALRADETGLTFHPSFHSAQLDWSDVESVELGGRRPARITIRLKRRFWSLTHPFTGRNVQLNIVAIGLSYRTAETEVRKMRRWLKT
jgi:hypothetical protein